MKKFLKYSAIGFAVLVLVAVFGPMIGGFLVGAAIAIGGYWLYERSKSTVMKLLSLVVIVSGGLFALGSVPFLLLLIVPVIGYITYKLVNSEAASNDPFENFETEWNKLS